MRCAIATMSLVLCASLASCGTEPGTDACKHTACGEHGRCATGPNGPVCLCDTGYIADDTGCRPDPCQEFVCVFGTCTEDHTGQPTCACHTGYSGQHCDTCSAGFHVQDMVCVADSACDGLTCIHGVCISTQAGVGCVCDTGYSGELCDQCAEGYHPLGLKCIGDSSCDPDPCAHGTCEDNGSGPLCHCLAQYTGDFCDQCAEGYTSAGLECVPSDSNPCEPNPCTDTNRTTCVVQNSTQVCLCNPGYQDRDQDGSCLPDCTTSDLQCDTDEVCDDTSGQATCVSGQKPPIYISFLWHMHQPIYWPYESITQTEASGAMGYSLYSIFFDRIGPYTTWPADAVAAGRSLSSMGAQVSFSGSLMENLDDLAASGAGFSDWTAPWREAASWRTQEGNPRLDMVEFGYHHPLMGLIDPVSTTLQILAHRKMAGDHFGTSPSKGIFPPECAFSQRMIPAFVTTGIQWTLVDNIHFDRARTDYPYRPESNLPPPNRADQMNDADTSWVELNGLWAPSPVSAPWGYQPHYVQYTDPTTGQVQKIIAVPAARYEGNEDARGGFGALQYESVMSQYENLNTDPRHPMLVVLHHDGDNYGGGTESYYHGNFQAFIDWVSSHPDRFVATTIQDYLDRFPPDETDIIHVEDGSWSGADNGDPQFSKWNGAPGDDGYSPDRNSWSVIIAATNRVLTAESILPHTNISAIIDATGNQTDRAWHYLLNGQTSCYWYWDGSQGGLWDGHPTRAANLAVAQADPIIEGGTDNVGPTIYPPQRDPYNPGVGPSPIDFQVWTLAYDVSGLSSVTLHYRIDSDGIRDQANEIYSGGQWHQLQMAGELIPSRADPSPVYQAQQFSATLVGLEGSLVDYYVSATDSVGNISRSALMHVYIQESDHRYSGSNPRWTKDKNLRGNK